MDKIPPKRIGSTSIKFIYLTLAVVYLIVLPAVFMMGVQIFPKSFIAQNNLFILGYFFIVGILYVLSTVFSFQSKRSGLILGVIASYIGIIPWIGSLLNGAYFFVKKEFKS